MIKKTIYRKKVEKKEIQKETRSQILNVQRSHKHTHTHSHSHVQDAKPNNFFANSL